MGFVEESFKEIEDMEKQKILSDERVKSLILQKSARLHEKKYGDVTIKFRTSINKKLRNRLIKAKDKLSTSEDMDEFLYGTLALLCSEEPWNNWKTWAVYDEVQPEDGIGAMEIFEDVMVEVRQITENIKGFR